MPKYRVHWETADREVVIVTWGGYTVIEAPNKATVSRLVKAIFAGELDDAGVNQEDFPAQGTEQIDRSQVESEPVGEPKIVRICKADDGDRVDIRAARVAELLAELSASKEER